MGKTDQGIHNKQNQLRSAELPPTLPPKRRHPALQWVLLGCFAVGLFLLIRSRPQDLSNFAPVDQIPCSQGEMLTFHVHAHLSIFANGQAITVPAAIGIAPSSCLYWLHTHVPDGIIHIEGPGPQSFTLGNFLDIWKQRFSQLAYPTVLDQKLGWQIYVNGKLFSGDFRSIVLNAHMLLTLAYQSPNVLPDTVYNWGGL